ncbi:MAG: hypothetical protein IJL58_04070 [Bacteroidales bacterium]|nr:hypothetical protein [Bacteroidales bacterium]
MSVIEQNLKRIFLRRNPYADDGINTSLQRNELYMGCTSQQKMEIKQYWREGLEELALKYGTTQTVSCYFKDLDVLRNRMNTKYGHLFCESGFRISHAQKSFSVYLKYRWCKDLIPAPPVCPIDSTVLNAMGRPWSNKHWTTMENGEYYDLSNDLIKLVEPSGLSIAQWELIMFTGRQNDKN